MNKHPITAFRATQKKNGLQIELLTQSPRGTQIPFKAVSVVLPVGDKEARTSAIQQGLTSLLAELD